jgi:signal transduction histidine kinase
MLKALRSIRFRIILPLIVVTLLLTGAVALYNLRLAEAAELAQARRNAILLADVLDAGIQTEADLAPDALQAQVGSLTAANPDTQEFNVILLQGTGSTMVASNDPGNLEATSPEEHQALLEVLQRGQPVVIIDREIVESTPPKPDADGPKSLVLSLFAPIRLGEQAVGAVNVKFVLVELTAKLRQMRLSFLGVAALETLGIVLVVTWLLNRHVLRPLGALKTATGAVAAGDLTVRVPPPRDDEIGALVSDFNVMTATLDARAQEVAKLEQLRDDLTHMIVHDMKSPLGVIIGYSGMLEQTNELTPHQVNTLARIRRSADTLNNMVLNLLDIRRMESGKVELNLVPVDFQELVQEALDTVRPLAEDREQTLAVKLADGLPPFPADREFLRRVLVNLLTNAVKHSDYGDNTTLQANVQACIEGSERDDHLVLRVIDQGEGIAPQDQARIFEKFTQAAGRTRGGKTDTGLGLAFCKLAVQAHGGSIGVESSGVLGKGSVFTVKLPLNCSSDGVEQKDRR